MSEALVLVDGKQAISGKLTGPDAFAYRIVAPVSASGIAVIGDIGKFVSMGRKRVASYEDTTDGVRLKLAFAADDAAITVAGYAPSNVIAHAEGASILSTVRDSQTGLFKVKLKPNASGATEAILTLDAKTSGNSAKA
jgi:hypothetical protein